MGRYILGVNTVSLIWYSSSICMSDTVLFVILFNIDSPHQLLHAPTTLLHAPTMLLHAPTAFKWICTCSDLSVLSMWVVHCEPCYKGQEKKEGLLWKDDKICCHFLISSHKLANFVVVIGTNYMYDFCVAWDCEMSGMGNTQSLDWLLHDNMEVLWVPPFWSDHVTSRGPPFWSDHVTNRGTTILFRSRDKQGDHHFGQIMWQAGNHHFVQITWQGGIKKVGRGDGQVNDLNITGMT